MHFSNKIAMLVSLLCLLAGQMQAQKFLKGTVILEGGEKINGYIQDNDLSIYTRLIAFKEDKKSDNVQVLHPEMIQGFITENDQKYTAVSVNFEFDTKGGLTHQYAGQRFARVLQEGKISIYELRDIDVQAWFIQKEGQAIELLSFDKKLNDSSVKLLVNNIADCGCIDYDETLPTKISNVVATVAEYNTFTESPMFEAAASINDSPKP